MPDKTIVYAGSQAGAMWRKDAREEHWQELTGNGLPPFPQARVIVMHPQNPELVYVGTQRGLYLSDDRGDQWRRADLPEGRAVWSVVFRPDDPRVMYLGTEGAEVFRSDDSGNSWNYLTTIVSPDQVEMKFAIRVIGLAIEARNTDMMYAALEVGGAARSFDAGKTWEINNRDFNGIEMLDMHGVQVASPKSDVAFISNRTGVWRTRDGGDHWENTHVENFSPIIYSRGVWVAPNDPNTLFAGVGTVYEDEAGGVVRSTDLGDSWERFDRGISPRSVTMGLAVNAQNPEQVYFCTRRGQVFGTHDGGATWKEHPLPQSSTEPMSNFEFGLMGIACVSV